MFLLITEDGEVCRVHDVSEGDFSASDAGLLDIINMTTEQRWWDGEWHDIEIYDQTPAGLERY